MNQDKKIYEIGTNFTDISKLEGDSFFAYEHNRSIVYMYAPFASTNVVKARFVYEKYWNSENILLPPLKLCLLVTDTEEIDAVMLNQTQKDGYYLWKYIVPQSITGINVSGSNMGVRLSFQRGQIADNDDNIGTEYYATENETQINTALILKYVTNATVPAVTGNFVNVLQGTSNDFLSWEYDGADFIKQTTLLDGQIIGETNAYADTIKPTQINASEVIDRDVTEDILQEIADINTTLNGITGTQAGLMAKENYDTVSDNYTVDKALQVSNVGVGGSDTISAATIALHNSYTNQDVTIGANPTFGRVVMTELRLNGNVEVGSQTWNNTELAIDTIINSEVTLQNGRELLKLGRNTSGVTITNGSVVAIIGSVGNVAEIELLDITDADQSFKVIGTATEDIDNNSVGNINLIGRVRGLQTQAWGEGTILYAGVNGELTDACPAKGNRCVLMAVVETSNNGNGVIWQFPRPLPFIGELSDVDTSTAVEGDLIKKNASGVFVPYNIGTALDNQKFSKTGFPVDITDKVTMELNPTTKIFTMTVSEDIDYYVSNEKYTFLASAPKTIDLTTIIGVNGSNGYFITLDENESLIASVTVWDLRADDVCTIAELYWNDTDEYRVNCAYELHTYEMSAVDHYNAHFTVGTKKVNGLSVTQTAAAETLDITAGKIMDEDIVIQILNGTLGSAQFTQELAPLKAYKYYRLGASEIYREEYDSSVALLQGGNPKLNPFDGSVYTLEDAQNNRYYAMWVVLTTDVEAPVQLWVGQKEAELLNNAIEENGLASMNFGAIPIQEIEVAYRVMVQRSGAGYTIEQIDSFADVGVGVGQDPATSHGSLSGLGDDDHTQYHNNTRGDARYPLIAITDGLDTDKKDKDITGLTSVVLADLDLMEVWDTTAGETKKSTMADIASYVGGETGVFVPSGDYKDDGLGANKTAFVTDFDVAVVTNADVKVDIKAPLDGQIIRVTLPTITSSEDLALSTDDGSTFYDVLVNGTAIAGTVLSGMSIEAKFNGTNWILKGDVPIDYQENVSSVLYTTFDKVGVVDYGTPNIDDVDG
ncbi:MAG: hypothetical protein ACTSQA_04655, partial [Candidatus Heimdallarchaeaceae archaeon]